MSKVESPYHDLVTEAINTKCYIYEVKRYDPGGGIKSLTHIVNEEEYDELKKEKTVYPDYIFLDKLCDDFVKEVE